MAPKSLFHKLTFFVGGTLIIAILILGHATIDKTVFSKSVISQRLQALKSHLTVFSDSYFGNASKVSPEIWKTTEELQTCSPIKSISFAKTHKTGSSTVQNIFLRYGWENNLTFVLPEKRTWMFGFKTQFSAVDAHTYPSWNKKNIFDMFIFHSIWNYKEVKKLVPKGPVITILRDPVDLFESGYVYMGLSKYYNMDINKFAKSKILMKSAERKATAVFGKNQLLWDLGLNPALMTRKEAVMAKIKEWNHEFDLVMIAEQFDESMLLLQNQLCWEVSDMTYLRLNERVPGAKTKMTEETRSVLRKWLWADYLVYDHFKNKLEELIFSIQPQQDFQNRLSAFRATNNQLRSQCVKVKGDNKFLYGKYKMALPIVLGYVINEEIEGCDLYAISEPNFFMMVHQRQMNKQLEL